MKLALFLLLALAACSGVDSGHDGGTTPDGSTNDSSSPSDASPQDGSNPSDAAADVVMGGDGGLNAGATCDPNNNQCKAGLLCCNEPTHIPDASTGYFCEQPVNKSCPLLP